MKPPRLTWIDYARGIAIILVVYRHSFEGIKQSGLDVQPYIFLEYANILFFSFRMPLFFIVSGIFITLSLQKRGLAKFIETKAKVILYPYFLWGALQLSIQIFFSDYTNYHPTLRSFLDLFYQPRELAQFWYLLALFNVTVLYVIAKTKLKLSITTNIILGLVMFYASTIVFQKSINIGFLSDILHNYIFIAIGDAVSKQITNRNNFKYFESWKILALLFIPFMLSQVFFLVQNLNGGVPKYMFVEYYRPIWFLFISLIGCLFIINLSFVLQKYKLVSWLHVLGKHSLYIYVAHVIAFAGVRILLTKVLHIEYVPGVLFLVILAGLIFPVILFKITDRLGWYWLFTLEKKEKFKSPEKNKNLSPGKLKTNQGLNL